MLHPSSSDLGQPFEYVGELWERTSHGGELPHFVGPVENGMRVMPGGLSVSFTQIQLWHGFNALDGILFQVASRVLLTNINTCDFMFGAGEKHLDPFSDTPAGAIQRGVFFRKIGESALEGRVHRPLTAPAIVSLASVLSFEEAAFIDLAIVVHERRQADFMWSRGNGTWASVPLEAEIPDDHFMQNALRPSFVYRQHAGGHLDIRSLHVEDVATCRTKVSD